MAERFRDSIKAAQYLSQGLRHDFPEGEIEVIRLQRGRSKHSICATRDAERVLVEACKGLETVNVTYHPANAYGFAAEVAEKRRPAVKSPDNSAGTVYVLIRQVKGRPFTVGSKPNLRPAFDLD